MLHGFCGGVVNIKHCLQILLDLQGYGRYVQVQHLYGSYSLHKHICDTPWSKLLSLEVFQIKSDQESGCVKLNAPCLWNVLLRYQYDLQKSL
jgi:hypothetical protein